MQAKAYALSLSGTHAFKPGVCFNGAALLSFFFFIFKEENLETVSVKAAYFKFCFQSLPNLSDCILSRLLVWPCGD